MRIRSAADSSQIVIVGNFDVTAQSGSVTFPVAGTWYDYLNGNTITATGVSQSITLQPGEYHLYLNRNLVNAVTTPVIDINNPGNSLQVVVYPNPVENSFSIRFPNDYVGDFTIQIVDAIGRVYHAGKFKLLPGGSTINMNITKLYLKAGVYFLKINSDTRQTGLIKLIVDKNF